MLTPVPILSRTLVRLALASLLLHPAQARAWDYSTAEDDMGRGTIRYASVPSENTVELDFPYGTQRGRLMLRIHPEYGKDVMFSVGEGAVSQVMV